MKKILLCFLASASLIACTNQETKTETAEQKSTTVEHIYKPTYTDNFKIGGEGGENAHIAPPVALQTDHPKLLFFLRV